ncbi:L-rhamnose isomerase [Shigella sonnei]
MYYCKASRRVSAYFGEQLGTPSVMKIAFGWHEDITVYRCAAPACSLAAWMR